MTARGPLPSLRTVQRVLCETTERLANECAAPTASAPAWDEFHWCIARAVATMHGVSPLLSLNLRWQAPHAWRQFLSGQWQHTHDRHQGITQLIRQIDAQARSAGIGIAALKGAALHDLGVYAPGTRPMADVDLLVRDADAAATAALLHRIGYREASRRRRERTFEPCGAQRPARFGESAANAVKIELHTRIAESLPVRECNITEQLLPRVAEPGLQCYESVAHLMTHLLLHAAGNMRTRSLRMIQINDIAALACRLDAYDWERVLSQGGAGRAWWAFAPLALTARYFPTSIPSRVLARAASFCPALLRRVSGRQRLSGVSLSHLWIEFCPGIEWCSSPLQVLRYMQERAFPSPEARAESKVTETTQAWASNNAWSRLPRARRVLRWLVSRPPRVATMWSIRAAWEQCGAAEPYAAGAGP